jgi:signal transduction histidine kinase
LAIAWRKQPSIRRTVRTGLLATAIVTVLIGGAGTIAISREVAVHQTQAFLLRSATALAILFARANDRFVHPFLASAGVGRLRLIPLSRRGTTLVHLPEPLTASSIDRGLLLSGHYQSGVIHNEVFVAYPVQAQLGFHGSVASVHPSLFALVITRPLPSIEGPVIFVITAVFITAFVALLLSDRYTAHIARTLDRLVDRSKRVAAGHLDDVVSDTPPVEEELANLDDAISSMITSLRAANEVESTYILAISHDLRTPLTSIRGFAEAIIDEAVTSPVEAAGTIQREAQRVERLINDLIALARLRASDYTLTNQRIDLNELISHLVEAVSPTAERHGLALTSSLPSTPTTIEIDPERLLQLLGNLLDNALKYAQRTVAVRLITTTSEATIIVTDDGDGIPPSHQAQLFAQQLNPTPGRDGTVGSGLGLLIVGRLAALMGLTIKVESAIAPMNGTTFRIMIPRTNDRTQPPRTQSTPAIVPRAPS